MEPPDDLALRLMDDLDPELLTFIRKRVNSFIKWDLVRFFHDNPYTVEDADRIAVYIGREEDLIRSEMDSLVEAGVLVRTGPQDRPVFGLTSDEATRKLIDRFYHACEDRQFRVKAIYHVIRGMHL